MPHPIDLLVVAWWEASIECDSACDYVAICNKLYTNAYRNYCIIDKRDKVENNDWYYDLDYNMWTNEYQPHEKPVVSEQKRFADLVKQQQRYNKSIDSMRYWKKIKTDAITQIAHAGLPRRLNPVCKRLQNVVPENAIYYLAAVINLLND